MSPAWKRTVTFSADAVVPERRVERREFLRTAGAAAFLTTTGSMTPNRPVAEPTPDDRSYWLDVQRRVAGPVLTSMADGTLKARMPVEAVDPDRRAVTHLEALGRLIAGIAPWLELPPEGGAEGALRAQYLELARRSIARAVDPASSAFLNFTRGQQPLVDAAFLSQGLLRAPRALRDGLQPQTRRNLAAALASTRGIVPNFNNWLLFAAMIEVGLRSLGAEWDRLRVDYALRQHEQWYKGDGVYGDGPDYHFDYYNSFVIHPMLIDILDACRGEQPAWNDLAVREDRRARRYAAVQERLIGPDGAFPPIGRSLAYRFGAFHLLAQMALRRSLPDGLPPAQVRGALTAVIRRSVEAPGTFDADGWLRVGFCGHQPVIGEPYISTGSLYLCAVGLLPLGLPASDPFWSAPVQAWTSARAWTGQPFPIDHAV
jgi:hypothetical protein